MIDPLKLKVPLKEEGDHEQKVTGLYTPMILSTEPTNH